MDYVLADGPYKRVKIAVVDTGLATTPAQKPPTLVSDNLDRFVDCESFEGSGIWKKDLDGHGTHTATLLLQVCPNAEIMVLRVVEKHGDAIKPKAVSEAINHAIDKGADIISISLGWNYPSDDMKDALERAQRDNVLVFAATSNDGSRKRTGIAYPASAINVIAVDSADGDGVPSGSNPTDKHHKGVRLAAPGEDVLSAVPPDKDSSGLLRKTGTSFATPIVSGIAALLLEFARQPPLAQYPKIAAKLKELPCMYNVILEFCSVEKMLYQNYRFLQPWKKLCSSDPEDPWGGNADDQKSSRFVQAYALIGYLRDCEDPQILH